MFWGWLSICKVTLNGSPLQGKLSNFIKLVEFDKKSSNIHRSCDTICHTLNKRR